MNEIVFTACSVFVVIETVSFLSGSEKAVKTVCSLAVILVILTSVLSALDEIHISVWNESHTEVSAEPLYLAETQNILEDQIHGALAAAGITDISEEVILAMDDSYEVTVDTVKVGITHPADIERAKIILNELFSESIECEVYLIDG